MTSSETQTERPRASALQRHLGLILSGVLLVAGWGIILQINRWYLTPPVLFLFAGWLGVLLSARYLWRAGWSVADDADDGDELWKPVGRREELTREKRALLKAIKEIEFDREMDKMSDEDARELTRMYRARAIAIIKALETDTDGKGGVSEEIERDVRARLALAGHVARTSKRQRDKGPAAGKRQRAGGGA